MRFMYAENVTDLLFYADKWNIGSVEQTAGELIATRALKKVNWLAEEDSDYSADPFVVAIGSKVYIYYEYLNFWEGKGRICQISNFNFGSRQDVQGIRPSGIHLSYPYIFRDGERICCIPETAEAGEIALYDVDPVQTNVLIKRKVLLSGAPYLDSSVISYNNRYWLFTNRRDRRGEYLVFYASNLEGPYAPHAMNPVTCNLKTFRNAGSLFTDNSILYRPTQNLEKAYGGSIVINRIHRLTETEIHSENLFDLLPETPYAAGMHNISFTEGLIVIDGKRKVFSPIMPVKKANGKIKYLLRKILR